MENKLDVVDDKVAEQITAMEQRLGTKLDSQHGILVALIDRVRSLDNEIIRQDTLIKTILGVPQLIDSNKIAKADRDDQRKRLKIKATHTTYMNTILTSEKERGVLYT